LKKQSQFPNGQNDVKLVIAMDYGEFQGRWRRENKAKQSQSYGETEPAQAIPIPMQDNRDEAATQPPMHNLQNTI
jgi:hypothetical protein